MPVLLIDDDTSFREVVVFHLADAGIQTDVAADGEQGLSMFDPGRHPVVVTDLKMPRVGGMLVLRQVKSRSPDTPVIVITAFGDMTTAVEAMKAGAFDFLPKPCDRDHLKLTVARAMEHAALHTEVRELRGRLDSQQKDLVYRSPAMGKALAIADRVAKSEGSVLIFGESGTGKELLARRIHRLSHRPQGPFVAVNCGAIPRDLVESELFGHAKGAFTGAVRNRKGRFEQAHTGTILLDEVGELPLEMQTRLLRVLQERVVDPVGSNAAIPVDVRVLSATNRDLQKAVEDGSFREDLYFRLAVLPVNLPPLRERPEDIEPLAIHFLRQHSDRDLTIAPALLRRLQSMQWRGNVRELENVCQRLALLAEDDILTEDALQTAPPTPLSPSRSPLDLPAEGISLLDLERDVIVRALEMNKYNQTQTAKFLRIPRHILLYRIDKYQIPLRDKP